MIHTHWASFSELPIVFRVLIACCSLFCLYHFSLYLSRLVQARLNGCQRPKRISFTESLSLTLTTRAREQRHEVTQGQADIHLNHGGTFEVVGLFTTSIYTLDPSNIRTVWAAKFNDWGIEHQRLQVLGPFCGRGLATTDGEQWKRTRGTLRPHFYGATAEPIDLESYEKYLQKFLARIPENGVNVDLQPLMYDLYFEASFVFLTGFPVEAVDGFESWTVRHLRSLMEIGVLGSRRVYFKGPLNFFQSDKQWQSTCRQLRAYCNALADKAERNAESYKQNHGDYPWDRITDPGANILIYKFLRFALTRTELVDNILQYFMGATPTVGGAITNATYLLSTHPEVWKKLQAEVLSCHDPLTARSVGKITFLRHVFLEVLRLYPFVTWEERHAVCDTILPRGGGADGDAPIFVPKGSMARVNLWSLHRDPTVFGPNANEFDPARWSHIKPQRWEFIPFGGGPRICLGKEKAAAETMYTIARMAQCFDRIEGLDDMQARIGKGSQSCNVRLHWRATQ